MAEQESAVLRHGNERPPTMLRGEFKKMLAAARRPQGGPARSDSAVWGAERSAEPRDRMPPKRHRSRCLRPSKHRRGRSARKAAPAPKPVGAARSGRSVLDGVQPVSTLPGKQGFALEQRRTRGTPLQLLRSEVASVWRGRDHCGSGALAPGRESAPLRDRSRMFDHRRNIRART